MNEITYYIATAADATTLADLRISFALELTGTQPHDVVEALRQQMNTYFAQAAQDGSCISVIAQSDGRPVGIGSVHVRRVPGNFKNPTGVWGYIMNMYTLPAYRRRGICSGILQKLVEEGRRQGIGAFELHATDEGRLVYEQHGFAVHNEPTLRLYTQAKG